MLCLNLKRNNETHIVDCVTGEKIILVGLTNDIQHIGIIADKTKYKISREVRQHYVSGSISPIQSKD